MEILSVGEKIKRLRTYKGIKLKDICNENLSISKISCIENNKIKPDKYSLEILASKLGTTYEYLSKDVFSQIYENIENLNKDLKTNNFDKYKYNLYIAVKYKIYDLVFYICNQMFKKFIFNQYYDLNMQKISEIIPIYFDALLEIKSIENEIIYNLDLACYFFIKHEYKVAAYYFKFLREMSLKFEILKLYKELIFVNEINCYINSRQYDRIYDLEEMINCNLKSSLEEEYLNEFRYFKIILVIRYNFEKFDKGIVLRFIEKCLLKDKVKYLYKICNILYEFGYVSECIYFCKELYSIISKNNFENYEDILCRSLIYISKIYIENSIFDKLEKIVEDSLNLSIYIGCPEFICESYFNKAILCGKKNDFDKLDTYIDLSVYFLNQLELNRNSDKFLSIGFLFYKLGNIYEAVKNFKKVILKKEM